MLNDTLHTRREFLRKGVYFVAAGMSAPFFLTRTAQALDSLPVAGKGENILVVIQLGGGNDGLNTVVPHTMDEYYRVRPTLGVDKKSVLKLDDKFGLHPDLAKLKELYDAGKMAVVHGVGYPNPDRSHFRSMEIWHTGDPKSKSTSYGWLGRYLDNACPGCDPRTQKINPLAGINIGGSAQLAMKSERGLSIALDNPDSFMWKPLASGQMDARREAETYEELNRLVNANLSDPHVARLDFLSRVAMNAEVSSDRIQEVTKRSYTGATYPATGLGNQLRLVARLIHGGLGTRVFYVSIGGFDTHANQANQHERLLKELAEAVSVFQRDLDNHGEAQRVLTVTFSEFGRRVAENGSAGTDHGTAAPMFVFGHRLKPGLYGAHPSLTDLDRGDLKFTTDFRSVYATILENWLGAKSEPVLGQAFPKLAFV